MLRSRGAYYNESDPFMVAWLRSLIHHGHLPAGLVDPRPIQEVHPDDLLGYAQCHFFAGLGGWAHALDLAGWPTDRPVWTMSCPCQPFSSAGKQAGFVDPRHLWPEGFRLIQKCRPPVVLGEQVESAIRGGWWDLVQRDLEGENYACGMAVLGAHSVGAPHIRQRCWFVANHDLGASPGPALGRDRRGEVGGMELPPQHGRLPRGPLAGERSAEPRRLPSRMADPGERRRGSQFGDEHAGQPDDAGRGAVSLVGLPLGPGPQGRGQRRDGADQRPAGATSVGGRLALPDGGQPSDFGVQRSRRYDGQPSDPPADFWSPCDWLPCRDGVSRPVEPGTFPLAHGVPLRVGRLRGYGNAIVPQVASAFIEAYVAHLRGDPLRATGGVA